MANAWAAAKAEEPLDPASPFAQWLSSETERVNKVSRERAAYPADPAEYRESQVAAALQNIWSARMVGDTNILYAEDAVLHASSREEAQGITAIAKFYMDLMSCIPDAKIAVDYTCSHSMQDDGDYVAARWTVAGTHTGGTLWGAPTGAPILILGESQYKMVDGKVVEEWLVFDELAVLAQVERARLR